MDQWLVESYTILIFVPQKGHCLKLFIAFGRVTRIPFCIEYISLTDYFLSDSHNYEDKLSILRKEMGLDFRLGGFFMRLVELWWQKKN